MSIEQIEIDIIRPYDQGYGWSVSCTGESCDDFGDKMLSYEGAKSIAKAHKKAHAAAISITEDGPELLKAMFPIGGSW
jgi:hypothetical protein